MYREGMRLEDRRTDRRTDSWSNNVDFPKSCDRRGCTGLERVWRYGETGEWVAMDCRGIEGGLLKGFEEWERVVGDGWSDGIECMFVSV